MKIKVEAWSHGSGCWTFYGYFESVAEVENYIKQGGYNARYFRYKANSVIEGKE